MKKNLKLLLVLLGVMTFGGVAVAHDDVPVAYDELPQKSRMFIEKYFGENPVVREAECENGIFTVELKDGHDLKFNREGDWIDVESPDMKNLKVSMVKALLPEKAVEYLSIKSLLDEVDEIMKMQNGGYLVEIDKLMNDSKIRFDKNGKVVKHIKD